MKLLGSFDVGEDIRLSVVWTPETPDDSVSGSSVTLRHATDHEVIGPFDAEETAENSFEVLVNLPRQGRWEVEWKTTPTGGVDRSAVYVQ